MAIAENNNKEILFMPRVKNSHHQQILIYYSIWFLMGKKKNLIAFVLEIKLIELWVFPVPPKVISQASALLQTAEKRCKKLHLFSADEHSLLLYVG